MGNHLDLFYPRHDMTIGFRVVKTARFFKPANCEEKDRLAG